MCYPCIGVVAVFVDQAMDPLDLEENHVLQQLDEKLLDLDVYSM